MVKFIGVVISSLLALPAWADDVGKVEAEGGSITITDATGAAKPATVGSTVDNGDVVATGARSWVVLNMTDGASLTLRPQSSFRIVAYHYEDDQPENNKSWLELVTGTLRSITGLIGKQNPRDYNLKTPTATIGIRGTDHETSVIDDEHATADAPAGTYDNVNDGETSMKTEQGEVAVQPGKAAYLSAEAHAAPRLLDKPPSFLARFHEFDRRQGINRVLGTLHQRVGNGAFGAHPDLHERLQRQFPERFHPQHANGPGLSNHEPGKVPVRELGLGREPGKDLPGNALMDRHDKSPEADHRRSEPVEREFHRPVNANERPLLRERPLLARKRPGELRAKAKREKGNE